ncbi:class I SAM-dependent methyltransferase [Pseudarthrobacter sp. H3Y2-7]|uniref:N5-glutamine methyltransferase family protein n=1 Tax=Pseudarthrobacter naphthalenicus TaxID=3031328 RepID=UPI0023B17013|nr:class I SAM-dependent methyltransferase [Pseudarthrobacter sp. H3Y2-7]MDE8669860.1 class I SAM-dependent methyltransferase [Pseudarthrobacter sp. H3Y2-7]
MTWTEAGESRTARWRSANGRPAPTRVEVVDDSLTADDANRMASQGVAMLWHGDFHNARQILNALDRRVGAGKKTGGIPADQFYRHRQAASHRARILGLLLIPLDPGPVVPLRRAPDIREAAAEAYGEIGEPSVVSLHELVGAIGAHEWRRNGVYVEALQGRIHPHYGTFFPTRSEYVDLVATAALPADTLAFDVGTGTGVLAAVLARRGVRRVVATDNQPRAIACAAENFRNLGVADRAEAVLTDMFPPGRAPLIVCNPPWLPATPHSSLDSAVYDPGSRMLFRFLNELPAHLEPGGEGWLVLSDLAEHLGLRSREDLLTAIEAAGLKVTERLDTRPTHAKASDPNDPLFQARSAEVTSLWRLVPR